MSSPSHSASPPRVDMEVRFLQGLLSILVWLAWTVVAGVVRAPAVGYFVVIAVAVLLSADAVSERPLCRHLSIGTKAGSVARAGSTVFVLLFALAAVVKVLSPIPIIDPPVTLLCAAQNIRDGVVPYTTYEPQCYRQVGYRLTNLTPLETGPFARDTHYPSARAQLTVLRRDERLGLTSGFPAFGYPPDSALILVPVAFSGWPIVSVWVAMMCAGLLAMMWRPPVPSRGLLIGWQLGGLLLPLLAFGWDPELVSYLLLATSFALSNWPRRSAVALAGAVCTNPLTWLAAPVYLVISSRYPLYRRRVAWLMLGLAVGIVPWIIWDHELLQQVWRFLVMPEFPIGVALGIFARLPSRSHPLYLVGLVAVIGAAAACACRWERWRWSCAVAVYLAFLVSWRGPVFYYFAAFWLAPAVLAGRCRYEVTAQGDCVEATWDRLKAVSHRWSQRRARDEPRK